jgi:PAS domain S-box-containing protein
MRSIVRILKIVLSCDYCALVYFDREGRGVPYALDPVSQAAAEVAMEASALAFADPGSRRDGQPLPEEDVVDAAGRRSELSLVERALVSSFVYLPLLLGEDVLGMLVLPNRTGGESVGRKEMELLRTVRAILSQGIFLHRTIVDLLSVKTYNENILNSLSDMGDTLVIMSPDGTIQAVNRATCALLGYREEDLVGRPMSLVTGDAEPLFTEDGVARLMASGTIANRELTYRRRDGTAIPMLFSGSVMAGEDGASREVVGIARDITEHRRAEDMAKNLLLVREIHHRIKNNLQVISSLLYLQSSYVEDRKTRDMFTESQNRVRSMALLHEKLYQSASPAGVDFSEYVRDLTRSLFLSYGVQSTLVELSIEMPGVTLGMDTAVPCGLIINELVSNSLKHAFPDGRPGKIGIEMRPREQCGEERWYLLTVTDDGKGFPEGLDYRTTESLGLKLVCTLTEQLSGTVDLERGQGTRFRITFREL